MNTFTHEILLDVGCSKSIKTVYAKQGDKGTRFIHAIIVSDDIKMMIENGATAEIRTKKPNCVAVSAPATINSDKTITAELTEAMLDLNGRVVADIAIHGSDQILSTELFYICVERSPF